MPLGELPQTRHGLPGLDIPDFLRFQNAVIDKKLSCLLDSFGGEGQGLGLFEMTPVS
jgi:hypothetical protein